MNEKEIHRKLDALLVDVATIKTNLAQEAGKLDEHKKDAGAHAGMFIMWGGFFCGLGALIVAAWRHG